MFKKIFFFSFKILIEKQVEKLDNKLQEKDKEDIRNSIEYHRLKTHKSKLFVCSYKQNVEKAMAPHSSTLAWNIPWTEEPGRLQFMGSLRVRHD